MPLAFSRLSPVLKGVEVKRVQSIFGHTPDALAFPLAFWIVDWNRRHRNPAHKYDANPWVWVATFEIEEKGEGR